MGDVEVNLTVCAVLSQSRTFPVSYDLIDGTSYSLSLCKCKLVVWVLIKVKVTVKISVTSHEDSNKGRNV